MEQVVARGNVRVALARVRENRGSPRVDRMTVEELPQYLMEHWQEVREQLLSDTYQPKAVLMAANTRFPTRSFQLANTPGVFADHDKWIRHRLRALQLKQWTRGPRVYAEMRRLGLSPSAAAQAACLERRWWHRAAQLVQVGLTTRYYDRLGVPRLAD